MDTEKQKPIFFLLSGPPGAGKSTSGDLLAPPEIKEVLDFDGLRFNETGRFLMKYKESTFDDADQAGRQHAAQYMDDKIDSAMANRTSFGVEDMIWGEQAWIGAKSIQDAGFDFHLTYLGLDGAYLSAKRVEDRISDGGHDYVSPEEAVECYDGNLKMLDKNYKQPDVLEIYDNSSMDEKFVVSFKRGTIDKVGTGETPEWVWASLPNIYEEIESFKEGPQLKNAQPVQGQTSPEAKKAGGNSEQKPWEQKKDPDQNRKGFRL